MTDFSLDAARERITDLRIRGYFGEVYSSYANGNYRSAVVMLWSVVVCDLLFKLDLLKTTYADPTAAAILTEIEDLRKKNPKSPEWEWTLVEKVRDRTQLLDISDVVNLESLQNHRHLSAHPVLTGTEALYAPTREQCRAHIRNALDGVLTKPAIMSRKVFDSLMEDIEATQALLPNDESLRRYLDAKYLRNLTPPVEQSLTKNLWRIVFKTTDPRSEANRGINYRVFRLLYARRPTEVNAAIQGEPGYYNQLTLSGTPLDYLMDFLARHPVVFGLLTDAATAPLRNHATTSLDAFLNAWFLSAGVQEHLEAIKRRVEAGEDINSSEAYRRMMAVARDDGRQAAACEIGIRLFIRSSNFDDADARCEQFVLPYRADLDADRMGALLAGIEANDQAYGRRQARHDHRLLRERADQLLPSGWLDGFPNFARRL
jgi:hypothetical protein